MEANHNTLQIIQNYVKTPSVQVDPPKTIKMEDITSSSTPSSLLDIPTSDSTPRSSESRSVKKRKSWGQVLPEPKTSLPPRKRAKTADEKEQRRIERVKRNRLAAHNSRERKRQEVEALLERNSVLEQHMKLMQQQLDTLAAMYPEAKLPSLPKLEYEFDVPFSASSPTPAPTTFISEVTTPAHLLSSPDSLLSTIDSPIDTAPSTPGTAIMDESDRTQQSAALLCDLPCQSDSSQSTSTATTTSNPTTASFLSALNTIILFNFRTFTTTAIRSSTLPSSRRTRIPSSTRASMVRQLAMALPAATRAMLLSRSMAASSICSPVLARSSGAATHRELRRSKLTIEQSRRHSQGLDGVVSAEMLARLALFWRNSSSSQRAKSSSHRRRSNRTLSSSHRNNSLARDIKRSASLIRRQMASGRQKRTTQF